MTSGTGTCTVKYDQAGNTNYNAAPQVTETTNATTAALTITANDRTKTQGTTLTPRHDGVLGRRARRQRRHLERDADERGRRRRSGGRHVPDRREQRGRRVGHEPRQLHGELRERDAHGHRGDRHRAEGDDHAAGRRRDSYKLGQVRLLELQVRIREQGRGRVLRRRRAERLADRHLDRRLAHVHGRRHRRPRNTTTSRTTTRSATRGRASSRSGTTRRRSSTSCTRAI